MSTGTLLIPIANGNTASVQALDESGVGAGPWVPSHTVTDVNGTIVTPSLDSTVQTGNAILTEILAAQGGSSTPGSTGHDYSANKPTLPNIGSNFAASGPYASYFLIATVPVTSNRVQVTVVNNAQTQIAVMRDDGTATNGNAPANASVFTLASGQWASPYFKGRVQVFAASSGAQVACFTD